MPCPAAPRTLEQVLDALQLRTADRKALLDAAGLVAASRIGEALQPLFVFAMLLRTADVDDPRGSGAFVVRWLNVGPDPDSPRALDEAILPGTPPNDRLSRLPRACRLGLCLASALARFARSLTITLVEMAFETVAQLSLVYFRVLFN